MKSETDTILHTLYVFDGGISEYEVMLKNSIT